MAAAMMTIVANSQLFALRCSRFAGPSAVRRLPFAVGSLSCVWCIRQLKIL